MAQYGKGNTVPRLVCHVGHGRNLGPWCPYERHFLVLFFCCYEDRLSIGWPYQSSPRTPSWLHPISGPIKARGAPWHSRDYPGIGLEGHVDKVAAVEPLFSVRHLLVLLQTRRIYHQQAAGVRIEWSMEIANASQRRVIQLLGAKSS